MRKFFFFASADGLIEVSPHSSSGPCSGEEQTRDGCGKVGREEEGEEESGEVTKGALIVTKSGGEVGLSRCSILMRDVIGLKKGI